MCVVSNMGDIGGGMWPAPWKPNKPWNPNTLPRVPSGIPKPFIPYDAPPTDEDAQKKYAAFMKSLKKAPAPALTPRPIPLVSFPTKDQFAAFDKLLRAAIEFDEATGQKECQTAAKTAWIKTMYEHFSLPCPL